MTSRIYYTDSYCRRFDAIVTSVFDHEGRPAATLDRTAFYPTSGGQPYDIGQLRPQTDSPEPGVAVDVIDTIDRGDDVVHVLSAGLEIGMNVRGEIDWNRRFDHMQQHTGQHVLSAALDRLFDNRTTSFHLGVETATIDLARELSWPQIARAEDEANRVVWENREVTIRFVDPGARGPADAPLQLRKESTRKGTLRLIEIADFDLSACGGTHVARAGAIGAIVVTSSEKFKGGTRLTFACGGRALGIFRTLRESVTRSVRALSVLPQELPAAIERSQAEAKELRRTIKRFQESLAEHEARRLVLSHPGGDRSGDAGGIRVIVEALDGWDAAGLKAIASGVTAATRAAVVLVSSPSPAAVVVARSPDVPVDATVVLRTLTDAFGGRGGGKNDLAQGGGLIGDPLTILSSARAALDGAIARRPEIPRD